MSDTDIGGTLAYWEWSSDKTLADVDLDDINEVRGSNPAFDTRINEEFLAVERGVMSDEEYARERFGIFPDGDGAPGWEILTEATWTAARSLKGEDAGWMVAPASLGIEMPPDRSIVSIGAAGACRDGGDAIDLVAQVPADELVDLIVALTTDEDHPVAHVVIDPTSPAGALIDSLIEAKVTVTKCKYGDLKSATGDFYDSFQAGDIRHRDRPILTAAVSHARKRDAVDTWLVDRRATHDPSPFGAVVLAHWGRRQPKKTGLRREPKVVIL